MWNARHFREILIAELTLLRGVAPPRDVAAALQRYWDKRGDQDVSLVQEIARIAGLLPSALNDVEAEVDALIEEADGDSRAALLSREGRSRFAADTVTRAAVGGAEGVGPAELGDRIRVRTLPPGRYEEFLPAGEGGMGIVYWALDTDLNRQVAFKVVHPRHITGTTSPAPPEPMALAVPEKGTPASEAFHAIKTRFLQEAFVTGGLEHPGIVPVYEVGQTPAGVPYYTMRFVRGQKLLRDAIASVREADIEQRLLLLEPFLKTCDTVHYAHSRGVIHLDLKPENIALGQFGEVVVLDWGLAKFRDRDDLSESRWQERLQELRDSGDLPAEGGAVGTPGYMSPEAVVGAIDDVDDRSDVYSLGVILYEILCGRQPYSFRSFREYVALVRAGDPLPPVEVSSQVPRALSDLCVAALQRVPSDRPTSVKDLATSIRSWQVYSAAESEVRAYVREAEAALTALPAPESPHALKALDRVSVPCEQALRVAPDADRPRELLQQAVEYRERAIDAHGRRHRSHARKRIGVAALALLLVVTTVFAVLFDRKRREAERATQSAVESRRDADVQRDRAERNAESNAASLKQANLTLEALRVAQAEKEQKHQEAVAAAKRASDALKAEELARREVESSKQSLQKKSEELHAEGRRTRALALLNAAHLVRDSDPILGLLLGRAADGVHPSTLSTNFLHEVIPHCLETHSLGTPVAAVRATGFSRDGAYALVGFVDGRLEVFDRSGGRVAAWSTGRGNLDSAWWGMDHRSILTVSEDCSLHAWTTQGDLIGEFYAGSLCPVGATVSPDGSRFLAWWYAPGPVPGSEEPVPGEAPPLVTMSVILWSRDGREVARRKVADPGALGFTPAGRAIALAVRESRVSVFDLESSSIVTNLDHEAPITRCALAPDGRHAATAQELGRVTIWDLEGGRRARIETDLYDLDDLLFADSGNALLCTPLMGTRKVYTLDGSLVSTLDFERPICKPESLRLNEPVSFTDGLLAVYVQGTVRLCVLPAAREVAGDVWADPTVLRHGIHHGTRTLSGCGVPGRSLVVAPDGDRILAAPPGRPARLLSMRRANEVELNHELQHHSEFCLSAGGSAILSAFENVTQLTKLDGSLLWRAEAGKAMVTALTSSADEGWFAAGTAAGQVYLWSADGTLRAHWNAHSGVVETIQVWTPSEGSREPVVCTTARDAPVRLWSLRGDFLATIPEPSSLGVIVTLAPSGDRLVILHKPPPAVCGIPDEATAPSATGDPTGEADPDVEGESSSAAAGLWDRSGRRIATLDGHDDPCLTAGFSADSTLLVTTSPSSAILWTGEGKKITSYRASQGEILDAFFTPGGVRIVERARPRDLVWIRDMEGTPIRILQAALPAVLAHRKALREGDAKCPLGHGAGFARSADGSMFLLELEGGTLAVIRHSGEEICKFQSGTPGVLGAQFSQGPDTLLVTDARGPHLVLLDPEALRKRAAEVAPRDFTAEEREYFGPLLEPQGER